MKTSHTLSRRTFLHRTGLAVGGWGLFSLVPFQAAAGAPRSSHAEMLALRRAIVDSPFRVGLHRAKVFTEVFENNEDKPWIVRKAMALRQYFETVPLYLREHDRIAGAISEQPGALPVMVELGIAENDIVLRDRPALKGYLRGQVPEEIREYWKNRNLWGQYRSEILRQPPVKSHDQLPEVTNYKLISNQGHLSPSYQELLRLGIGGLQQKVRARRQGETGAEQLAFLRAAEEALAGLSSWARRYGDFLAQKAQQSNRAAELGEMARICSKVASDPPETFREAVQLIWLAHQAIHIEGHAYACTPDHLDQLLLPFCEADIKAGRLEEAEVIRLVENFVLKMADNTVWGPGHNLTQGLCMSGSTPEGRDLTNRLSWLMVEGATNMNLPQPLIWVRWHPAIDQKFFDFCLTRLSQTTCYPMYWNDKAIPEGLMALGVSREDAFCYLPVGCNELSIPGQFYFNPGAHLSYLAAIEAALTGGKGYKKWQGNAPGTEQPATFDQFCSAVEAYLRAGLKQSYKHEISILQAQMKWGQTPLCSCFFEGCVDKARDLAQGTKYNILSCGGICFANAVDCLAAVREVVYEKHQATLQEVTSACAANFQGYERLRARLQAAPKHGNDDPRLDAILRLVERMRDEAVKEICIEPRGGRFGNSHVVRDLAVTLGAVTPATPDGRLAGTPVASSVAASAGCERTGPTALLNSVAKLNGPKSWQCAYQANIRFGSGMVAEPAQREKLRAMLNVYFQQGGQEIQINVVNSATLRAAQKHPEQYRDLVVRVAGFSEFFVNLTPQMQEEVIARAEH